MWFNSIYPTGHDSYKKNEVFISHSSSQDIREDDL